MQQKLISRLRTGLAVLALVAVSPMLYAGQAAAIAFCPTDLNYSSITPNNTNYPDSGYVSVGTKFIVRGAPQVTGVKFYDSKNQGSTLQVHFGTVGGSSLASKTFNSPSESPPGWRTVAFDDPVDTQEGVDYIVWVSMPNGHYAVDTGGSDNGFGERSFGDAESPFYIAQGESGYYKYTSTDSDVPDNAVDHNYWVGPIVDDEVAPDDVTSLDATDDAAGPEVTWDDQAFDSNSTYADGGTAIQTNIYRTTGMTTTLINRQAGSAHDVAVNDATALPGTNYVYSTKSVDACGNESTGTAADSVDTSSQSLESLFSTDPANTDVYTDKQVVGMHWQTSTAGDVWGGRIYRAASTWPTSEPLKVMLWDGTGTLLASRTLPAYSEQSGWIDVRFDAPVSVSANTDYVIGYYTSNGRITYTNGVFENSSVTNSNHLTGQQNTISEFNGVYDQGSGITSSTFPANQSANSAWYGIDVDFYIP